MTTSRETQSRNCDDVDEDGY